MGFESSTKTLPSFLIQNHEQKTDEIYAWYSGCMGGSVLFRKTIFSSFFAFVRTLYSFFHLRGGVGGGGRGGFDANKETKYGASVIAVNSNNSTNAAFLSQGLFADPAPLFNDTIFKN
jgi:hypothetical protein